jgi:hypothetical protein
MRKASPLKSRNKPQSFAELTKFSSYLHIESWIAISFKLSEGSFPWKQNSFKLFHGEDEKRGVTLQLGRVRIKKLR